MGVTKQAAQKRFVAKGPNEVSDLDPSQGFSRFDDAAISIAHLTLGLLAGVDKAAVEQHLVSG